MTLNAPNEAALQLTPDEQWRRWIRRYEWHLDQVPGLLEAMRANVVWISSDAARYGAERISSSRTDAPLPFRVDAVDAADDLWAALVQYAGNVADLIDYPLPAVGAWRTRSEVYGIRSSSNVRRDAYLIVAWLIDHVDVILPLSEVGETEDFLFTLIRRGAKQYLTPRPTPRRRCRVCASGQVIVRWTSTGEVATCDNCHDEQRIEVSKPTSGQCADGAHDGCESLGCLCSCHERRVSLYTPRVPRERVPPRPLPPMSSDCDHHAWTTYLGDDELRHCAGCGQVR